MQAIESIENAGLGVPSRSSPFRALIWKEWRQQRWIFLSLAGLAYALLILSRVLPNHAYGLLDWRTVMLGGGTLVGVMAVLVLSANAFAGERDDETDQFLDLIPCARSKVFWVKLGFVLFLIVAAFVPIGFWILAHASSLKLSPYFIDYIPIPAVVAVLLIVPPLIASFGVSVIATILISIPVSIACAAWVVFSPALLQQFLPVRSGTNPLLPGAILPPLIIVTLLLAALRSWSRMDRTWRKTARTAATTAGLLIAYVAVPAAAAYLYVTCFAPLSIFTDNGRFAWARVSGQSPNGEYVTLDASYSGWGKYGGTRSALVNVESGQSQWLTRFRFSALAPGRGRWSPSGNQFVLTEAAMWLWPLAREADKPPIYFVVDARSGEKRSFDELCPGLPQRPGFWADGWYDEHVFTFRTDRDIFFADIEHHQVRRCKMPAALPGASFQYLPIITRRGVFAVVSEHVSAKGELSVLRYAPDLAEAESLTLHAAAGTSPGIEASADGQWLLVNDFEGSRTRNLWRLARLTNGAEAALLVSDNPGEKGLIPPSWKVKGFLPGSHQILLYRDEPRGLHVVDSEEQMGFGNELGLFDADSHELRRIGLEDKTGFSIYGDPVQLSPRGGFVLVMCKSGSNYVVDLRLGTSTRVQYDYLRWLGEDHLLSELNRQPVVINRDGTGARPLLAK